MKNTNRFEWSETDVVVKAPANKRLPDSKTLNQLKNKWRSKKALKKT